jgi:hypothetical protein
MDMQKVPWMPLGIAAGAAIGAIFGPEGIAAGSGIGAAVGLAVRTHYRKES